MHTPDLPALSPGIQGYLAGQTADLGNVCLCLGCQHWAGPTYRREWVTGGVTMEPSLPLRQRKEKFEGLLWKGGPTERACEGARVVVNWRKRGLLARPQAASGVSKDLWNASGRSHLRSHPLPGP